MYQKLLNSTGEQLMISNFVNAANIGNNFMKMFHNSRGGANNFNLNCSSAVLMCSACSQFNFSCWRTKRPQGRHSTWWLLQKDLVVESATFHAVQDVKESACNMNSRANLALLGSLSIGRLGPTFPKQVEVDNFTSCWGQSIFPSSHFRL